MQDDPNSNQSPNRPPRVVFRDPYASLGSANNNQEYIELPQSDPIPSPVPINQELSSITSATPKFKRISLWVAIPVLCIVLGLGAMGWVWYLSQQGFDLTRTQLERTSAFNTEFLYPRSWHRVSDSYYADSHTNGSMPRASIRVQLDDAIVDGSDITSSQSVDTVRSALKTSLEAQQASESLIREIAPCASISNITYQTNATKNPSSVGLATIAANCAVNNQDYIVNVRLLIGDDQRIRKVAIVATTASWQKNQKVFEMLLNSVDVASTANDITWHSSDQLL